MMRGMLFSLLCQQALKRQGRPSGLIGQYKPYLNSNDSPTRDILKDYSGQGHDIQLYNFGYALQSGYGSYVYDFLDKTVFYCEILTEGLRGEGTVKNNSLHITKVYSGENIFEFKTEVLQTKSFKIRVSGLKEGQKVKYHSDFDLNNELIITSDGEYILPETNKQYYGFIVNNSTDTYPFDCNITVEQIPDYPGALVSDGVDDYGLCENFPILTKEKGYTIVAIRKWLNTNVNGRCLIGKRTSPTARNGAFNVEYIKNNGENIGTVNFGDVSNISSKFNSNTDIIYQTSKSYQGLTLSIGLEEDNNTLNLFRWYYITEVSSIALYALEIYDRDLTDEEIKKVKEAMYDEYLTATNALQNHIIADYECYDKTNEDEDRDVLKDLSGNGHDIQLYNFGFAEGSGYGLYAQNFNRWQSNDPDKVKITSKTYDKVRLDFQGITNSYLSYIFSNYYNYNIPYKVKCESNLNDVKIRFLKKDLSDNVDISLNVNGITEIPVNERVLDYNCFIYCSTKQDGYIELEIIPEYQGALVSDGVDDYGLCENFPILNKEDGFTILAIRKWLNTESDSDKIFLSNSAKWTAGSLGAFSMERINSSGTMCNLFGNANYVTDIFNPNTNLIYQTNNSYQGKTLTSIGTETGQDVIALFCNDEVNKSWNASVAFYRMVILNKNCTTEEIKFIAKQMVAKHKEKTGETIELNF